MKTEARVIDFGDCSQRLIVKRAAGFVEIEVWSVAPTSPRGVCPNKLDGTFMLKSDEVDDFICAMRELRE